MFSSAKWFATIAALALLSSCSGGCGSCTVPAFNATPTPTLSPGATPTPKVSPTPTPTAAPTPTPGGGVACSQGGPSTIALGAAAPFALLGAGGITNTGNTFVTYAAGAVSTVPPYGTFNDDLIGAYPTTTVTGLTGANVSDGATAIYATGFNSNTAFLTAAQTAVTNAYTLANAEAPTAPTFSAGTDLSQVPVGYSGVSNCGPAGNLACGLGVLGAGVYKSASTLSITAGALTLDGGGNSQSVFIFQIGSALTMAAPGGTITLINGANGCNIYWADLSGATLGGVATGAAFYGDILAPTGAISINTAITSFHGRALAGGAAVTISSPTTGLIITNPGGN